MIEYLRANIESIESINSFVPPTTGSISLWLIRSALTAFQTVWFTGSRFRMIITGSQNVECSLYRNGSGQATTSIASIPAALTHIGATWVPGGTIEIYLNGVLDISEAGSSSTPPSDTMKFGLLSGGSNYYDGEASDFRIYNRQLSAPEFQTIFASNGHDIINHGLLNRWPMNEKNDGALVDTAEDVKDILGGNNMTGINTPTYRASELNFKRRAA